MAAKRNRWLIGTVLILALGAFLALSILPILGGIGDRSTANGPGANTPNPDATQAQADLEAQAKGYELVLEREPDNQTALRGLVETQIQLGQVEAVVDPLERLAELNPQVTDYTVLLGQTKEQLGDLDGAAQAYRTVLDSQPGNMNALQGLVALLVQQQRPQAAIGLLQDTLTTAGQLTDSNTPPIDQVSVKLLLAQVYVEDSQVDQALELYDETIAEAAQDFRPLLAKALVLQQEGDVEAAQGLFDQATAIAPAQFKDQIQAMRTGSSAGEIGEEVPGNDSTLDEDSSEGSVTPDAPAE